MDQEPRTTDSILQTKPREIPLPVKLSLATIENLKQEGKADDTLLAQLKKSLPVLAMKLAQNGHDVTTEILAAHAQSGPAHIKTLCESFDHAAAPRSKKTWDDIVRAVENRYLKEKLETITNDAAQRTAILAQIGTLDQFRVAFDELRNHWPRSYDFLMSHDNHPLLVAARAGNLPVANLVLENNLASDKTMHRALIIAAKNGHRHILEPLVNSGTQNKKSMSHALCAAASEGQESSVLFLTQRHAFTKKALVDGLETAIFNDHASVAKQLEQRLPKKSVAALYERIFNKAEGSINSAAMYKSLSEHCHISEKRKGYYLLCAIARNEMELVKALLDDGVSVRPNNGTALQQAASHNKPEIIKYLIQNGHADPLDFNISLLVASRAHTLESVHALVLGGANPAILPTLVAKAYKNGLKNIKKWDQLHGGAPENLGLKDPELFNPAEFKALQSLLRPAIMPGKLYDALTLFQTADRVIQYIERYASVGNESYSLSSLSVPDIGAQKLKMWGDAILKHGPKMADLMKYADKISVPEKSPDGKEWSYTATLNKTASYMYRNGHEYPELAALGASYSLSRDTFNAAAKCIVKYKTCTAANDNKKMPNSAIPDIRISGKTFGMPDYSFFKLPSGDTRGLFLGQLTDCCQSIGAAGDFSARHGFLSPDGGFYVVANDNSGEIIGETWAWRGKKGEIVFDSLETLGHRLDRDKWTTICKETARQFKETARDVTALLVGRGGGTPELHTEKMVPDCDKALPKNKLDYSDARNHQYEIWRRTAP